MRNAGIEEFLAFPGEAVLFVECLRLKLRIEHHGTIAAVSRMLHQCGKNRAAGTRATR